MASGSEILLTKQQHSDLSSIAQSRALPAGYVFRAKLILMLAGGASFNAIKRQLQTTAPTIVRWKQRFRQHGLEGLDTYHPGQKPSVLTPALRTWFCWRIGQCYSIQIREFETITIHPDVKRLARRPGRRPSGSCASDPKLI